MKIYRKNLTFLFSLLFFLLKPLISLAWIGYEETTNIMIDVLPESEIEIGNDISYYDFKAKAYHNAYVIFTDYTAAGLRIEVKDLESAKKRVFIMDQQD